MPRELHEHRPYPGGPVVHIRDPRPELLVEACVDCGRACTGDFTVGGKDSLCGWCWVDYEWRHNPDRVPPGMEMGGTGI
jgi:hypothetical protein